MSLQRQLLTILFCILSAVFLFKAGFLTIQHFVIMPNTQPLLVYAESNQIVPKKETNQPVQPAELIIPDQQIDLSILPSSIINGEWQVTSQGVSLITPAQLGNRDGGYVLYGHDWPILLGKMRQSVIGQKIKLLYGNGKVETYQITSTFKVTPSQSDILKMAKPDTVVIYTCSGFMDSQRFVVLAQLQ